MGTYDIDRYLTVRSASGPSFGPDGERLSFLLDTTGVDQLWTLDGAGRWPIQRTFYDERITFGTWSPERPELVFGMDEGGNERAQLYRLDATAGTIDDLTRTPDAKHYWGGFSHGGERIAFASNRRDESVFDIYVQGLHERGDEATVIHEGDGWLFPAGWSPDDRHVLVVEMPSSYDQDLYRLDVETGDFEHLTPHDGDVRFLSPRWAPTNADGWDAGDGVYVVTDGELDTDGGTDTNGGSDTDGGSDTNGRSDTDGGNGTTSLSFLDPASGELRTVVDGGEWNIGGIAIDDDTGRFVFSRNVDGYTEFTAGEIDGSDPTEFETFPTPELPRGVAGGVSFDPQADRFACVVTADTLNANVYVVDVETGRTERWTDASTAGIPRESFQRSELVRIESFDGLSVPGFLTVPNDSIGGVTTEASTSEIETIENDTTPDDGLPVIVDIHGGPASQRRPSFSPVKQYFVDRGYAYFEPNVRGSSGYGATYAALDDVEKRMDSVADVAACVDWLAEHPAIDSERIACMGGSYGGFMVLASMTEYPELWAAGVDIVGIANWVTFLENTGDWRRAHREAEYGSLEDDREFLESISPINRVDQIEAPLFVLHGENDPRVPVSEAEQIVAEAREYGVPVRKLIFDDEGHGFSKLENRIDAYGAIADFLDEHV